MMQLEVVMSDRHRHQSPCSWVTHSDTESRATIEVVGHEQYCPTCFVLNTRRAQYAFHHRRWTMGLTVHFKLADAALWGAFLRALFATDPYNPSTPTTGVRAAGGATPAVTEE